MSFTIEFRQSVEKDLKPIPEKDQVRILQAIQTLVEDPFPPNSKKLSGQERYRLRQGNYRVLYEVNGDRLIIVIVRIKHRREAYK